MLATVIWIGGQAVFALLIVPSARRALDPTAFTALIEKFQARFDALGWFSVAVLLGSGMLQMSASPHYEGFLTISNPWAGAILVKHILFAVMVAISAVLTWGVLPATRRAALRQQPDELDRLHKRQIRLVRLNLLLGVLVLALTAFARAS